MYIIAPQFSFKLVLLTEITMKFPVFSSQSFKVRAYTFVYFKNIELLNQRVFGIGSQSHSKVERPAGQNKEWKYVEKETMLHCLTPLDPKYVSSTYTLQGRTEQKL